jgi:bacteriocin biosynthesis cyclodehydratase domain-containing protein
MTAPGTQTTITSAEVRLRARTQLVSDGSRVLLRLGERTQRLEPFDQFLEDFLHRLARGGELEEISAELARAHGPGCIPRARALTDALERGGFLETAADASGLEPADLARFSRLVDFFSEFETGTRSRLDYLRRLRTAHVTVLGTGGMGCWVVYNLLCVGVGRLTLIDGDRVEASNLNRSILYTEADIGRPKVAAARDAIQRFAPRTEVAAHDVFIDAAEPLAALIAGTDLLVGCADQPPWLIRQWSAEAARTTGVPLLSTSGLRIGPFYLPGHTSCPMCDWAALAERNPRLPVMAEAQRRLPRGTSGSLSPLAMMAAGPAALDIFRYLSGYAAPASRNAIVEISLESGTRCVPLPPHPRCPVCGDGQQPIAAA